jgi:hypothetical protein
MKETPFGGITGIYFATGQAGFPISMDSQSSHSLPIVSFQIATVFFLNSAHSRGFVAREFYAGNPTVPGDEVLDG